MLPPIIFFPGDPYGLNSARDKTRECCPKINREVYLTFDDGIQAGTEEILSVLGETNVRATFFLTGVHIYYFYRRYPEKFKKVMSLIYNEHEIGNHSWSHANEHYRSFYREGGVMINNNKERRSVVNDFEMNKNQILWAIDIAEGRTPPSGNIYKEKFPLSKKQSKPCARFPGTNTWYVDDSLKDIHRSGRGDWFGEKDTQEEAEELYKFGYKIFGWDCEWNMNFNFNAQALKDEEKRVKDKTMDYSNMDMAHPDYDMYAKEFANFDRPIETWQQVRDEILEMVYNGGLWDDSGKREEKAIVLLHDRGFRGADKSYAESLKSLIKYFKGINAKFKTLDDY